MTPKVGVIRDSAGNLYGTTETGGANCLGQGGCGTVFEVNNAGQETVLYSFCSETNCVDGYHPLASLIQDAAGNLYGTTFAGGVNGGTSNAGGTVFKLAPPAQQGGTWTETVLYNFCSVNGESCTDGAIPLAGLIEDKAGNLYGTTEAGGSRGHGTVFKVDTANQETVLYNFCSTYNGSSCTDGSLPNAALIRDAQGNFYGTTEFGGANGLGGERSEEHTSESSH